MHLETKAARVQRWYTKAETVYGGSSQSYSDESDLQDDQSSRNEVAPQWLMARPVWKREAIELLRNRLQGSDEGEREQDGGLEEITKSRSGRPSNNNSISKLQQSRSARVQPCKERVSIIERSRSLSMGSNQAGEGAQFASHNEPSRDQDQEVEDVSMPGLDDYPRFDETSNREVLPGASISVPQSVQERRGDRSLAAKASPHKSTKLSPSWPPSLEFSASKDPGPSKPRKKSNQEIKAAQVAKVQEQTRANLERFEDIPNVSIEESGEVVSNLVCGTSKAGASRPSRRALITQDEENEEQSKRAQQKGKAKAAKPLPPPPLKPMPPFSAQTNVTSPGGTSRLQSGSGSGSHETGSGGLGQQQIRDSRSERSLREEREEAQRKELRNAGSRSDRGRGVEKRKAPELNFGGQPSTSKPPQSRARSKEVSPAKKTRSAVEDSQEEESQTEDESSIASPPKVSRAAAKGKELVRGASASNVGNKRKAEETTLNTTGGKKSKVRFQEESNSPDSSFEDSIEDVSLANIQDPAPTSRAPKANVKDSNSSNLTFKQVAEKAKRPPSMKTVRQPPTFVKLMETCKKEKLELNQVIEVFDKWVDSLDEDQKKGRMSK